MEKKAHVHVRVRWDSNGYVLPEGRRSFNSGNMMTEKSRDASAYDNGHGHIRHQRR